MKIESVAAPTSVTQGAATEANAKVYSKAAVYITGVDGTYQLQITIDGTNFVNYGSAQSADGVVEVTAPFRAVRWDCTAFTSGTPTSTMVLHN